MKYFVTFLEEEYDYDEIKEYVIQVHSGQGNKKSKKAVRSTSINVDYFLMQLEELQSFVEEEAKALDDGDMNALGENFKIQDSVFITAEFITYFTDLKNMYHQTETADVNNLSQRIYYMIRTSFENGEEEEILELLNGIQVVFQDTDYWVSISLLPYLLRST